MADVKVRADGQTECRDSGVGENGVGENGVGDKQGLWTLTFLGCREE